MASPLRITFLGGLGQIGRNCAALESEGRIVVLDCGQMFAGDDLPGVDSVLPDLDWLINNARRVEAVIATHAHEDHIGALPYLLRHMSLPVYGSVFTLGMVEHKLREAGLLDSADLRTINDGDRHRIGPFDCEFLPVTHSIPSGNITAFHTAQGVILHSSDFKLDLTPIDGRRTDLSRIGALAQDPGIRLLLADSTNADLPGSSRSEKEIGAVLTELLRNHAERRVIVACFASHIHRLQQVADAALATNRMLVPVGLSMLRNVKLARKVGVLRIADYMLRDAEEIGDLDPQRVCVICTGSQGEPKAALTRMARGDSRWLRVGDNDTVIFSAHPIPGNEAAVGSVRNGLARRGAKVVHSGQIDVHTSGHAQQQELKTLHSVSVPQFFVPVHGEYSHLVAHRDLALEMGMAPETVLLAEDGDQLELSDAGLRMLGSVGGEHLYVDGTVGDLGNEVLGDRHVLGNNGFVSIHVAVDLERLDLLAGPDVVSRGWVEQPALLGHEVAVADAVEEAVLRALSGSVDDRERLSKIVSKTAGSVVFERTRRRPMLVVSVREG